MELFKLVGSILVDNEKANKSIDKTSGLTDTLGDKFVKSAKKVGGFAIGVGAAAGAVGAGLFKMASDTAATADNIDKMSQRLGLSRQCFQELDYVLSQSGVDINSFQTGMKSLLANMDKVTEGNKTAIANFEKLGVTVTDSNGKMRSQEEVLKDTIIAFQNMTDGAEKSRLAQELLGKQGQEIMPLLNSEAGSFESLSTKAKELGLVLSDEVIDSGVEFTDTMDTLKRTFGALGGTLGGYVLPIVNDMGNWLIETGIPKFEEFIGKVQENAEKLKEMSQWVKENRDKFEMAAIALSPLVALFVAYKLQVNAGKMALIAYNTIAAISTRVTKDTTTAQWGLNSAIAFITSPIGIAVAAIAGMIAIGVLLYKNWDTVKEKANDLWEGTEKTFDNIGEKISNVMDGAREKVKNVIDGIKNLFNFNIKFPHIPMPHFGISPSDWDIGDLLKGKIPNLSVDYYAKAMNEPMRLDGATLFGLNANGQPMVGGEKGTEYITGEEGIKKAVAEVLGQLNLTVVLDSGEIVGAIGTKVDRQLQKNRLKGARGI